MWPFKCVKFLVDKVTFFLQNICFVEFEAKLRHLN